MTEEDLNKLADAWIRYYHAPKNSKAYEETVWATEEELDLLFDGKSEELWQVILKVHERDQSIAIRQVLSAGTIENLLSHFGELYIERVEEKARQDPAFAKVLGGVWQDQMSDEIWSRLQAVWDRRGWDGIPE
ncbi:hypothetical protein RBB77_05620 [Tunturibacter psychrotolerans]|uniref:DUF6869 domain-containing protein n=1 Tax=Tunturiibacter psychrotolerans TaxID=3069686 RepID=A0AAU7ZTN9_9BACT